MSQKLVKTYHKTARNILFKNYDSFDIPNSALINDEHMAELGASVLLTRDKILQGGSFVQSVVNNDLLGAIQRADYTAGKGLKYFLYLREYVHFDENGNLLE